METDDIVLFQRPSLLDNQLPMLQTMHAFIICCYTSTIVSPSSFAPLRVVVILKRKEVESGAREMGAPARLAGQPLRKHAQNRSTLLSLSLALPV